MVERPGGSYWMMEVSMPYLYRGRLILGGYSSRQGPGRSSHSSGYAMSFARGTVDVDRLIVEAMADSRAAGRRAVLGSLPAWRAAGSICPGQAAPAASRSRLTRRSAKHRGRQEALPGRRDSRWRPSGCGGRRRCSFSGKTRGGGWSASSGAERGLSSRRGG